MQPTLLMQLMPLNRPMLLMQPMLWM